MVNKIYKNVQLGEDVKIYPPVIIGLPTRDKEKNPVIIGDKAVIRSFTVIYSGVEIGDNFQCGHSVMIRENNIIGNNVSVGTNTTLEPGNRIGSNVRIHTGCFLEYVHIDDGVFIGPCVVFTDDLHPPCPRYKECLMGAHIKKNAKIGANATILPGIIVGENSLVGAGSVISKNVPKDCVAIGNPAKVIKAIKELKCIKGFFTKPYEWRKKT